MGANNKYIMEHEKTSGTHSNPISQVLGFPSCWVIPHYHGIQTSEFLKSSEDAAGIATFSYSQYTELNGLLIRYMFTIAHENGSSPYTRYAALHLLQSCLAFGELADIQLTALVSLLVTSKFYDHRPITIDFLHKKSLGHYSTPQLTSQEAEILRMVEYNVHRPEFVYDKIVLYFHLITPLIPSQFEQKYFALCMDLCDLLHEYPAHKFLKRYGLGLLASGVMQAALVVATKADGKFPVTVRLAAVTGNSDSQIRALGKKIVKYALGKEMCSRYDL